MRDNFPCLLRQPTCFCVSLISLFAETQMPRAAARVAAEAGRSTAGGPTSLYLGNLQWWTTDAELETLCAKHGTITSLKIFEDRKNGKSQGYALVDFQDSAAAKACKESLHG